MIIPPNVGVAIGLVMSMPEPVANMIGRSPSTVVATVISLGLQPGDRALNDRIHIRTASPGDARAPRG